MRKLLISILSIALGAALIYGATMAWFTDEATVEDTTFTAGTVTLGTITVPQATLNVNPGDTYSPTWNFKYTGSKAVYIRVKYEWTFTDEDGVTELSPGILDPIDASEGWTNGGDGYMYFFNYQGSNIATNPDFPGSVAGVGAGDNPREITLQLTGKFDGAGMNNDYQGSILTIGGTIQAIQASHVAPGEIVGVDGEAGGWEWDNVFPTIGVDGAGYKWAANRDSVYIGDTAIAVVDYSSIASVEMVLYDGNVKLATMKATQQFLDEKINSFGGTFYGQEGSSWGAGSTTDGYWDYVPTSATGTPDMAKIIVTDTNGISYTDTVTINETNLE